MKKNANLSIIYVYFNTPNEIIKSLEGLSEAIGDIFYEVIIVDNNSLIPLPEKIKKSNSVKIIKNKKNYGYGGGLNIGVESANSNVLLFANPDTIFKKDSIKLLYEYITHNKKIGVLGPQLITTEGFALQSIAKFPNFTQSLVSFSLLKAVPILHKISDSYHLRDKDRSKTQEVDVVGGACMMIKKDIFLEVGQFDESFFMYFEESDLCRRVQKAGYHNVYFPKAKVVHLLGKSELDTEKTEVLFETSRYNFFKKYYGFINGTLLEFFLRLSKTNSIFLLSIIFLSFFMNLYKINTHIMFIGDIGRDYLAARDMLVTGNIPLVGIPSSVTWLHQGPLSVYIIGIALFLGKFNPVAPAVAYSLLGVVTTFIMYKLGRLYFNLQVGILSSLFFATSPLVVISERMPYHTAPIPLFSLLFFWVLYLVVIGKKERLAPVLFFLLGILLLFELSNAVLIVLLIIVWWLYKPRISLKAKIASLASFFFGIFPFVVYDITHGFVQTVGFPLWVLNRVSLFFGLVIRGSSTASHVPSALLTNWEQINRILFPASVIVVLLLLVLTAIGICKKRKEIITLTNKGLVLSLLWVAIPLIGYSVHAAPGSAYFPLIFGGVCLLVVSTTSILFEKKILFLIFIILAVFNSYFTIKHDYFLNTYSGRNPMPPGNYDFGPYLKARDDAAYFIVSDSRGAPFRLKSGGFLSTLYTGIDNYKYLILLRKGTIDENAKVSYVLYEDKNAIKAKGKIVYQNPYVLVTKDEND